VTKYVFDKTENLVLEVRYWNI